MFHVKTQNLDENLFYNKIRELALAK